MFDSYAENYLDCVFNAVKHHCSFEAAKWQAGFDARSLKPILEAYGCIVLINDQDNRGGFSPIVRSEQPDRAPIHVSPDSGPYGHLIIVPLAGDSCY